MKKEQIINTVFWILIAIFIIIVGLMTLFNQYMNPLFLPLAIIFFLVGVLLIFLVKKEKASKIKKYLFLTGISSSGFFVFVFLHNMFYALGTVVNNIPVLSFLIEIIHIVFFFIAIFACPIGFLVGVIGSIIQFVNKRKKKK